MSEAILKVEALEAGYGEVQVLWGVSLKAVRGHLTAIVTAAICVPFLTRRQRAAPAPGPGRMALSGRTKIVDRKPPISVVFYPR